MSNRYLVIVRAGDTSLHPQWTDNLASRDWDLVVSYFGSDPALYHAPGATRIDDPGFKWAGLHALLTRTDFWRKYAYIWCPDDDLATTQASISRFFARVEEYALLLAQPALSWSSHYSHQITLRHPGFRLRYTDFVEVMAPCFERAFLEQCLPSFPESRSGWGLDRVWQCFLPPQGRHAGIVDEVEVTHTRPIGGPNYALLRKQGFDPFEEMAAVLARYRIRPDATARLLGAVDVQGGVFDAASGEGARILQQQAARDMAAFRSSPDKPPYRPPGRRPTP